MKWIIVTFLFFVPFATQASTEANFLNPKIFNVNTSKICVDDGCKAMFIIKGKNFVNSNGTRAVRVGDEWADILRWSDTSIVATASESVIDSTPAVSVDTTIHAPTLSSGDPVLNKMFDESIEVAIDSIRTYSDGSRYIVAGPRYSKPERTYYRDSYWTSGLIMMIEPYVVRDQILLLARGINPDGSVPSAIPIDSNDAMIPLWLNHHDSGSYFVMMVHDYIRWTGDTSILSEVVNGKNIFVAMEDVLTHLYAEDTDGNYLSNKPKDSYQDWLDSIPRGGEVAYNQFLYYRALRGLVDIAKLIGKEDHATVFHRHSVVLRFQINTILWNDIRGYYFERCEDGECVDRLTNESALAVLYDVIDPKNRDRFLNNLLQLETIKNSAISYGDWGVVNAYPFYEGTSAYSYQNGTDWPFLDGINAGARLKYANSDWYYPLTRWWTYYNEIKIDGQVLPEFVSPIDNSAGVSQAWSVNPAASLVRYGIGIDPDINGYYTTKKSPNGEMKIENILVRGRRISATVK